jgi:hypothetical protein
VLHTPLSSLLKSLRFLCRPKPVVPESFKALLKVVVGAEQALGDGGGLTGCCEASKSLVHALSPGDQPSGSRPGVESPATHRAGVLACCRVPEPP